MVTSSEYTPLDSLLDLACRDGVDIRPTLLRVLTDLYVQKPTHSLDETAQYTELAVGLIGAVDAATRAVVAARLAAYPCAPTAVLQKLAATSPAAARLIPPALEQNPITPNRHCDARSAEAIQGRQVRPGLLRRLVGAPRNDGSDSVRLHDALNLPRVVAPRLTKPDFRNDFAELFFSAPAGERRLIVASLDVAPETHEPPAFVADSDLIRHLESAALRRNTAEFKHLLGRGLGLGSVTAERIAYDSSGEAIVVAAKAIGMTADVLQRILLFLNPVIGHSVERVFGLTEFYHGITASAAGRMVAIWRDAELRPRPMHAPHYFDDETADARSRAMPARQRAAYPREAPTPRARSQG